MIKAIIFDYLGVLVHNFDKFYRELSKISGKTEQEVKESFSKHWQLLKVGKITDNEFWERMKLDLEISNEEVEKMKIFVVNLLKIDSESMEHIQQLSKKYKLYLLSNSCYGWSEVSFNKNGLKPYFQQVFFSHNIGLAKPDNKLYLHVLNQIKIAPREIIFIDDNLKNVIAAKALEFKAIQFQNWKHLLEEIQK